MDYFQFRDDIFASNLTSSQKLLALAISYHYNWKEKRPAFPSNSTLSKETGLSISTIVRAKRVLSETGWVVINMRWDGPCEYTPCSQRQTNNEVNNDFNNDINNDNKSSNEDLYNSNTKKIPKEIIEIKEMTAAAPWDGWK